MGLLDDLKGMFRREARAAKEWVDEVVGDANTELDRAERRISDDPEVAMGVTLDDIADGDAAFEAVRDRAEGRAVAPSAEAELGPEDGVVFTPSEDTATQEPDADLPPIPGMAMARMWVQVSEDASERGDGFHALAVEDIVGPVVDEDWFAESFADAVQDLPEVSETIHPERELLLVKGPDLTAARARLLVAHLLAPRIGTDWRDRIGW